MNRVYSQSDRQLHGEMRHAAIAIKTDAAHRQQHVGILYSDDSDKIWLAHLGWHKQLHCDEPSIRYLWVDPNVPTTRLLQVAVLCELVVESNPDGIPYALSAPNACFDRDTGEFLFGPSMHGLTCATFVLALFDAVGLRLVRYEEWPGNREGDKKWQEWIVSELEKQGAVAPDHVLAVKSEVGGARFRPEEVAGAATVSSLPAGFKETVERAVELLSRLSR